MGDIIDGVSANPEWIEQAHEYIHEQKLNATLRIIALRILEHIPSHIPEDFTITLGSDFCEILQNWHNGVPDERFFDNPEPE